MASPAEAVEGDATIPVERPEPTRANSDQFLWSNEWPSWGYPSQLLRRRLAAHEERRRIRHTERRAGLAFLAAVFGIVFWPIMSLIAMGIAYSAIRNPAGRRGRSLIGSAYTTAVVAFWIGAIITFLPLALIVLRELAQLFSYLWPH